jgi:proliferating cell nuclear antigen
MTEADGFEAIIDADTFDTFLEHADALIGECKLRLDADALRTTFVEPSNVAMGDLELDADAFESYRTEGGVIGVAIETIRDVLSLINDDTLVHLWLDAETRKLELESDGLEYTLGLIDPDAIRQEPDLPELELAGRVVLEGRDLDQALTAADLCSDHVLITGQTDTDSDADREAVVIGADGDIDTVEWTFGLEAALDLVVEAACQSLFSLDYLNAIESPLPASAEVAIRFGDELPMRVAYSAAEGYCHVDYLVAPRVEK